MNTPTLPAGERTFVSTGTLPSRDELRALVETAYVRFRGERAGAVADYIPALAEADPAAYGICVASPWGDAFALGDADVPFSIQSVSKPFVFALVCEALRRDPAASHHAAVIDAQLDRMRAGLSDLEAARDTFRKAIAADAFWTDDSAAAEQAEVLATIAHRIKFRMKTVLSMPLEKRTRLQPRA